MNSLHKPLLFFGPRFRVPPRYTSMMDTMCREVCAIRRDSSFLLFRLFKFIMLCIQFAFPYNWIGILAEGLFSKRLFKRHTTSLKAYKANYFACEIYILVKFLLPLMLLTFIQVKLIPMQILLSIFVIETVLYILSIVFVPSSDGPASHSRSSFLLLLGFMSCTLSFAYIYWSMADIDGLSCTTQAIYFSLVTASTTGFGEIHATSGVSQRIVSLQIITSFVFLVSFFPVFFGRTVGNLPVNQKP